MANKFILIGFFMALGNAATMEYNEATPDGISNVNKALIGKKLFKFGSGWLSETEKTKLACPNDYLLCEDQSTKNYGCIKTEFTDDIITVMNYPESGEHTVFKCNVKEAPTVDPQIFKLFLSCPKLQENLEDVKTNDTNDISCALIGYTEKEKAPIVKYFAPKTSTLDAAKNITNWQPTEINSTLKIHYDVVCGTKADVKLAVKRWKRSGTKADVKLEEELGKTEEIQRSIAWWVKMIPESSHLWYYILGFLLACGTVILICTNRGAEDINPEDGPTDMNMNDFWSESNSELSSQSSDFIISMEELKKLQTQQMRDEEDTTSSLASNSLHSFSAAEDIFEESNEKLEKELDFVKKNSKVKKTKDTCRSNSSDSLFEDEKQNTEEEESQSECNELQNESQ